jgi:hypothetical protein
MACTHAASKLFLLVLAVGHANTPPSTAMQGVMADCMRRPMPASVALLLPPTARWRQAWWLWLLGGVQQEDACCLRRWLAAALACEEACA